MRARLARIRSEAGQSTTELALMLPVLLAFTFWMIQANIIMFAYHQGAYASFMAARAHLVTRDGKADPDKVAHRILTGKLFTDSQDGSVKASADQRRSKGGGMADDFNNAPDGVTLDLPGLASLPYVHAVQLPDGTNVKMLEFTSKVPTHLGPNSWDMQIYSQMRDQDGMLPKCFFTDNNLKDSGC